MGVALVNEDVGKGGSGTGRAFRLAAGAGAVAAWGFSTGLVGERMGLPCRPRTELPLASLVSLGGGPLLHGSAVDHVAREAGAVAVHVPCAASEEFERELRECEGGASLRSGDHTSTTVLSSFSSL